MKPGAPALPWLRRLRWVAVTGQAVAVVVALGVYGLPVPRVSTGLLISLAALSNLALYLLPASLARRPGLLTGVLLLDVLLLTALLQVTGAAANPFTLFYLVHVAMAAAMLSPAWAWTVAAAGAAGYGWLFTHTGPLLREDDPMCSVILNLPQRLHVTGMLVAFLIAAACIVLFGGRLRRVLQQRETELAAAREAALRQERFTALATLAAGAAHELGSPLGTIAVAAGEMAAHVRRTGGPEELLADAELICEEVQRCRSILDRLHEENADQPRLVTPAELLAEVRLLLAPAVAARLRVVGMQDVERLHVPVTALAQALATLVRNGAEAGGDGTVRLRLSRRGESLAFEVEDEGAGLAAAVREHAGEPFFTTKPPGQGLGLGLFLVRLLAARLQGRFELRPAAGCGTIATLELPAEP